MSVLFTEVHKIPDTSLSSLQDEFLQPTTNPLSMKIRCICSYSLKIEMHKTRNSYNSWGIMPQQNSLILTSKTDGINAIYYITTSQNRNYSCMESAEVENLSGINNILFISNMERDIIDNF